MIQYGVPKSLRNMRGPAAALVVLWLALFAGACLAFADGLSSVAARPVAVAPVRREILRLLDGHDRVLRSAMEREHALHKEPEWHIVTSFEADLADVRRRVREGDLAGAYDLAISLGLSHKRDRVQREIATAVPFLVLGPFGGDRFTHAEDGFVRPRAGAMAVPYIDEFRERPRALYKNWHYLRKGFNLDTTADYIGVGGHRVGWHRAWQIGADGLDFGLDNEGNGSWSVVYGWTDVWCPDKRRARVDVSADAPCIFMWLNRALVGLRPADESYVFEQGGVLKVTVREDPLPYAPRLDFRNGGLTLRKGWNTVLVKTLYRPGGRFFLQWCSHERPFAPMQDLRYRWPGRPPEGGTTNGVRGGS